MNSTSTGSTLSPTPSTSNQYSKTYGTTSPFKSTNLLGLEKNAESRAWRERLVQEERYNVPTASDAGSVVSVVVSSDPTATTGGVLDSSLPSNSTTKAQPHRRHPSVHKKASFLAHPESLDGYKAGLASGSSRAHSRSQSSVVFDERIHTVVEQAPVVDVSSTTAPLVDTLQLTIDSVPARPELQPVVLHRTLGHSPSTSSIVLARSGRLLQPLSAGSNGVPPFVPTLSQQQALHRRGLSHSSSAPQFQLQPGSQRLHTSSGRSQRGEQPAWSNSTNLNTRSKKNDSSAVKSTFGFTGGQVMAIAYEQAQLEKLERLEKHQSKYGQQEEKTNVHVSPSVPTESGAADIASIITADIPDPVALATLQIAVEREIARRGGNSGEEQQQHQERIVAKRAAQEERMKYESRQQKQHRQVAPEDGDSSAYFIPSSSTSSTVTPPVPQLHLLHQRHAHLLPVAGAPSLQKPRYAHEKSHVKTPFVHVSTENILVHHGQQADTTWFRSNSGESFDNKHSGYTQPNFNATQTRLPTLMKGSQY